METKQKAKEILDYVLGIVKVDDKVVTKRYYKEIINEIGFMIDTD